MTSKVRDLCAEALLPGADETALRELPANKKIYPLKKSLAGLRVNMYSDTQPMPLLTGQC